MVCGLGQGLLSRLCCIAWARGGCLGMGREVEWEGKGGGQGGQFL